MPFRSKQQMKACFASNGFNGKIDCEEWAKETKDIKSLPNKKEKGGHMYRGCMKCGGKKKMQPGGIQIDPRFMMGTAEEEYSRPEPEAYTPVTYQNRVHEGLMRGIIEPKEGYEDWFETKGGAAKKTKKDDIYTTLMNISLGSKAARTGLGWLSGMVDRNRQNQFDYEQQSALGQMNPIPVNQFQPNPYSLYAKYGGSLKTIARDFKKWNNPEPKADFGSGPDDEGKMQGGGRSPIYTDNLNDPRLKAYNDSLNLYNATAGDIKALRDISSKWPMGSEEARRDWMNYTDAWNNKPAAIKLRKEKSYQNLVKLNGKNPSAVALEYLKNKDGSRDEGNAALEYKKPVQPIIYRGTPPEPKITRPVPMNRSMPDLRVIGQALPAVPNVRQANFDSTQPTDYSFTYPTGKYNEQETTYFPDENLWRNFISQQSNVSSQLQNNKGTATGNLREMKNGGLKVDEMVVRDTITKLLRLGRLGTGKYRNMKKGGIHIKKSNEGKFTEYCDGKVTSECIERGKNSPSAKIRKRATFAANARKWNK